MISDLQFLQHYLVLLRLVLQLLQLGYLIVAEHDEVHALVLQLAFVLGAHEYDAILFLQFWLGVLPSVSVRQIRGRDSIGDSLSPVGVVDLLATSQRRFTGVRLPILCLVPLVQILIQRDLHHLAAGVTGLRGLTRADDLPLLSRSSGSLRVIHSN